MFRAVVFIMASKWKNTMSLSKKLDKYIVAYLESKILYSNFKIELQLYTRVCFNLTNTKLYKREKRNYVFYDSFL